MVAILSHPEWNKETSGLEVAKAFADQIKGKSGTLVPDAFNLPPLTIRSSRNRRLPRWNRLDDSTQHRITITRSSDTSFPDPI
jgi:hypothetical protein